MKFLVSAVFCLTMASAQTVPLQVHFSMIDATDNYNVPYPPVPGATVRLVLGESKDWQNADAGHQFVTDAKGEGNFTMNATIDQRWQSRNIGFTPFSWPSRTNHMTIATELDHKFDGKTFRWRLTMDLDEFSDGQCRTVGFMGIYPPDAQGRFTKALERQGGSDSWKVPQADNKIIWGMSYEVADFSLDAKARTLKFAVKKLGRQTQ